MDSHDQPQTPPPARRRIIQQPLRTEPERALIVAEGAHSAELEALLKRDRRLSTFPSISHFLAEPARREPWAAVVIARAGAWDPRFDSHVRRRRAIALFAPAEEIYGWPEGVARVGDLTELSAWLEALDAPEPIRIKAAERREQRAQARAALDALSAHRPKQSAPRAVVEATAKAEAAAAPEGSLTASGAAPVAAAKTRAKRSSKPAQLELAIPEPVGGSAPGRRGARASVPKPAKARTAAKKSAEPPRKRVAAQVRERNPASKRAAERTLMLLAAELGLARAGALLDALRKRAAGL